MHADVNNAGVAEGMGYMGLPLDHAVSAFIEDLEARGLSDKILLVAAARWAARRGSTRTAAATTGATSARCCSHGGGLKMGQVIGQSTANGGEPAVRTRCPSAT